jgi:hypothetical protein
MIGFLWSGRVFDLYLVVDSLLTSIGELAFLSAFCQANPLAAASI